MGKFEGHLDHHGTPLFLETVAIEAKIEGG